MRSLLHVMRISPLPICAIWPLFCTKVMFRSSLFLVDPIASGTKQIRGYGTTLVPFARNFICDVMVITDIVKAELLDQIVADGFSPVMAFDDRNQVVEMWRARGIPCAQVAPGDF